MSKVELKNITKIYSGDVPAVDDVSFEVNEGEFAVLVGPSGCGKSTLLRMVAGLEEITSGGLYFDGACVNSLPPKDRDIGMVFQNYALYPHMTVFENIAFPLSVRKESKTEIKKSVHETAEMLGLAPLLERKPKELSGGQRQRVALGRAIVRKPKVFLFDEPLSNLDAKLRVSMRAEITEVQRKLGTTAIYVTHDQVEAMTMGTKLVVLRDGKLMQTGSPGALYNDPDNQFTAGFIGSPQMNFFSGKLVASGEIRFEEANGAFALALSGKSLRQPAATSMDKVTIGIRPENVELLHGRPDDCPNSFSAVVKNQEYIGHETLLHFSSRGGAFALRSTQRMDNMLNKEIKVRLPESAIFVFGADGNRL